MDRQDRVDCIKYGLFASESDPPQGGVLFQIAKQRFDAAPHPVAFVKLVGLFVKPSFPQPQGARVISDNVVLSVFGRYALFEFRTFAAGFTGEHRSAFLSVESFLDRFFAAWAFAQPAMLIELAFLKPQPVFFLSCGWGQKLDAVPG